MSDYGEVYGTYENGVKCTVITGVRNFDVGKIFDCGQAFRFNPVPGRENEWEGVAFGRYISVRQNGNEVTIVNSDAADFRNIWKNYFALDENYADYDADIVSRSDVPALSQAVKSGCGIRILRQDPWEALCSFIISQNNNIPRIKSLIDRLCRECGKEIICPDGRTMYSFPDAAAVASLGEEALKAMKTGFRAGYIQNAAECVADGRISLDGVSACVTADASRLLQTLRGVGPKVAACVLLFGFGKLDAFPVDVWIKKVIAKYFPGDFSPEKLGPYAGIAQQYLFYYERQLGANG